MNRPLPFVDLLAHLRDAGIAIGVDDHIAVQRLLERYDGTDRDELGDAIAALLGHDEDDVVRIRRAYDALYPQGGTVVVDPPRRRWWLVVVAGALAAVAVAVIVAELWPSGSGPVTVVDGSGSGPPPPPNPSECTPSRRAIAPRRSTLPSWVGLGLFGVAGAMFVLLRARRRRGWASKARKSRLERLPGPRGYRIVPGAWLSRAALDDVAILLAARSETRELDIERTVERTVRAGLAPVLAYRTRRRRRPVAVAIDREPEMRPFRAAAAELARGLQDRGVTVEQPAGLVQPAQPDAVTIAVSTGAALDDPGAHVPAWIVEYAQERRLVWVTPIEDARRWPPALRAARIPVFPFHHSGLVAAARYLGGEESVPPGSPPLRWEDVERLRAMLAISIDPSPALAERLRKTFLPRAPQSIHEAVHDEPLPDPGRAAAWLARIEPGLDAQVRRFLLDLVIAAEPAAGSAAHLRWRRDRATLMSSLPEHVDEARVELVELAAGPLGDAVPNGPRPLKPAVGDPPPRRWFSALLWCLIPIGAAIAALYAPAVLHEPMLDPTAYKLRLEPSPVVGSHGRLRIEPVTDQALRLYDYGAPAGMLAGILEILPGTHCYQIWQPVGQDRYAGSPPLYVGDVVRGPGTLTIHFTSAIEGPLTDQTYHLTSTLTPSPQAATSVPDGKSDQPLTVPAGTWQATASRTGYVTWGQEVLIESGKPLTVNAEMTTSLSRVTLELPRGLDPSQVRVDGKRWDGKVLQRSPGPMRLTSADPYWVLDQTVDVAPSTKSVVTLDPRHIGIVRFTIEPADARRGLKIIVPTGLQVVAGDIRGAGSGDVTLLAPGYQSATVSIELQPGRTIIRSVTLTSVPATIPSGSCSGLDIMNLMAEAKTQYQAGFAKAALELAVRALVCTDDPQIHAQAALFACSGRDAASARRYFTKAPETNRSAILQACLRNGIDLNATTDEKAKKDDKPKKK